ncbi:hypothetical protein PBI_WINKY_111 [Mycobacterium phage Winky]|uniref:Uncharacterized protein n=1 Tax=Mycobacterium phage Faith1 TaxID=2920893 RepID=F6M8A0_9CAUD|nr:hypothetical protein SEA_FAITH1_109 [Mycobacterium phage Faith1]AGK87670.1 hypothetical protein PBI_WINKY_111 [Mycobacterium phage Winky]AGM12716.1 hypothetical protein PBI_BREEZONA_111 [Mycobacterium phage Breezona]AOT22963.1 hypothetical protein SEA_ZAKAI_112 [Mycobacterium phage Zakai]ASM62713.1 hypothetical protein SEA_MILEY16_111 [Mycobacterium phage Miley16]AYN57151.1 hypothetical protein PBI_BIGCHEESE_110 [Mycobacterium phage BigCheese]QGJ93978.1 hypothetical protein SEA_BOBSGARAGE_
MKANCQGILGWIFGHKFKFVLGDYDYDSDHCTRCGMPKGGWTT